MTGTVDIQELKKLAEAALRRPLNAYHEASIEAVNFYRAASPSTILALIEERQKLIDALRSAQAYVKHWKADRDCNLMPTEGSLADAAEEFRTALEGVKG